MSQNRPPPAYQEFAASMMARVDYRTMALAERGLLYTMRLECWVNHSLPSDPGKLAKLFGFDRDEIVAALPAVLPFFQDESGIITCPELENYRSHLACVRAAQIEGGKRGAELAKRKKKSPGARANKGSMGTPSGDPKVDPRVLSSVKPNLIQPNKTQSLGADDITDPWIAEYDEHERKSS